jgi:hypothetical protein
VLSGRELSEWDLTAVHSPIRVEPWIALDSHGILAFDSHGILALDSHGILALLSH